MTWLTWRQFRTQALVVFGGLALLAVATVVTGLLLRQWTDGCTASADCVALTEDAYGRFTWMQVLLRGGAMVLPAVTGMFFAAPLVAREFDTGTFRMVWTQSVSRSRWLATKVLVVGTATVLASGLMSWLTTWWFDPSNRVEADKFVDKVFGTEDVVVLGYAAFAFAVGLTAGLLVRKVLPAMATTLGVYVATRLVVMMAIRPRFASPLTVTSTLQPGPAAGSLTTSLDIPDGSWVFGSQIFDPSGRLVPPPLRFGPEDACFATQTCLKGYSHRSLYQPWSRYWPFQWTETGLFVVLALLLVGFCFWWINGHRLPGRGTPVARVTAPRVPDERTARDGQVDRRVPARSSAGSERPRLMGVDR